MRSNSRALRGEERCSAAGAGGAGGGGVIIWKIIDQPNPLIILIAVLAAFQVYASLEREKTDKRFYEVTPPQRAAIAVLYFALVIFLGHQTWMTYERLELLRR